MATQAESKVNKLKETLASGEDAARKDLGKIITRLKQRQGPLTQVKTEVDEMDALNFKSVTIKAQPGIIGFIGSFYSTFTGPMNYIANFLAKIPLANNLKNTLESGGLYISAEAYLVIVSSISLVMSLLFLIVLAAVGAFLGDATIAAIAPLAAIGVFLFVAIAGLVYPVTLANERAAKIDRVLPFALRQLSTQVKAGVSFYKALLSLAHSKYGVLSDEMRLVLRDMDSGLSTQDSLNRLYARTRSSGLRKAIMQIIRAMRTGGNLSQVISDIADDVSFETRMKIRDFTEQLNFINIIYIMVSVVAPVSLSIMSAVMQIPMFATSFTPWLLLLGFTGIIFGMIVI
ncbi:MAG: type II secretion system F family protein, partial [Candidatus Micrarchaeota archaeon]